MNNFLNWVKKNWLTIVVVTLLINIALVGTTSAIKAPTGDVPHTFTSTAENIRTIFNVVILVGGIIFVILLFVGGIKYLTSAGNKEQSGKARKLLIKAIIGLVIVFVIWVIGGWIFTPIAKPIIYLYPTQKQETSVEVNFKGKIDTVYPKTVSEGINWLITAYPDGRLINNSDGNEYYYLFWEGRYPKSRLKIDSGFVVNGDQTAEFLDNKLTEIGLNAKERNDFKIYWLPHMQNNRYNLISFNQNVLDEVAPIKIDPNPDSILRLLMLFKPLGKPIQIEEQQIKKFERSGFTVVEWGGAEL